jgi:predicted O-methyltransferase YrrM
LSARVALLQSRLEAFREQLAAFPAEGEDPGFLTGMEDLLAFIGAYEDTDAYAAFEKGGPLPEFRACFARHLLRFTWAMEGRTYAELLASIPAASAKAGPRLAHLKWQAYTKMEETLKLVDFASCRRVLVIGSGRVPASLLYLHDWTDVEDLVGVDRDPQSVAMARQLVDRLGMRRIRLVEADACDLDYGEFDVIYLGPFAMPRRKIMARVVETARSDAVVILRDPFFTGTLLFEPVAGSLDSRLAICAESAGFPGRFRLKHYVLRFKPLA